MKVQPLSVYVLTYNSERYLDQILKAIRPVADDLLIVDSGSTDQTRAIAEANGARFVEKRFNNFREQRNFASDSCQFDHVLFLDSDEIPEAEFVEQIRQLKQAGFTYDAYRIRRHWYIMGRRVHCAYPVECPDYPVRLIDRRYVHFGNRSGLIHESPQGYRNEARLEGGAIHHYTFETRQELERKIQQYSQLSAREMLRKGREVNLLKQWLFPFLLWVRWYVLRKGWMDGQVGWTMGMYVVRHTYQKYSKARQIKAELAGQTVYQPGLVPDMTQTS